MIIAFSNHEIAIFQPVKKHLFGLLVIPESLFVIQIGSDPGKIAVAHPHHDVRPNKRNRFCRQTVCTSIIDAECFYLVFWNIMPVAVHITDFVKGTEAVVKGAKSKVMKGLFIIYGDISAIVVTIAKIFLRLTASAICRKSVILDRLFYNFAHLHVQYSKVRRYYRQRLYCLFSIVPDTIP